MNIQRPTSLLLVAALTYCFVICTGVKQIQPPEFLDGSYSQVGQKWTMEHRKHRPTLVNQLHIKEEEDMNVIPRPSTKRALKLNIFDNAPHGMPDDSDKYNLKAEDLSKIWNVGKVRQLLFKPIQNKHGKRAYDSVKSHSLPISERWDGQTGSRYEEQSKAVNERRGKYRLRLGEKIDQSKCVGQKDGLFEVGPCERWYLSCRNGKAKKNFCTNGLYWNGDKSRCEPKTNNAYCQLKFDCTGKDDGVYVDGCSNVFWLCNSETASLSKCPKDLYFSVSKMRCDFKETIPACGGIDQDEMKSINSQEKISRKSRQHWMEQITHKMWEPHRKQDICEKRKDGKYAMGKCYEKFIFCASGKSLIVKCRNGQLYSPEYQQCMDARNLPFCRNFTDSETTAVAGYSVSCSSLPDGTYELADCDRHFSICRNGMVSNASCGSGLVYNGQTGHCDYEFNVEKCPKFKGTEEAHEQVADTDTEIIDKTVEHYRKQNICQKWEDGMYAIAKCYGKYLFCIDGRGLVVVCSHGQLFSPEHQQCVDARKLLSCIGLGNTETTTTAGYASRCSSLPDGVYELGNCERNFLICFSGEGSIASCNPDFVYNGQTGHCDYRSKVEKCSKYRKSKQRRDKSALSHEDTDCRCKGQKDGLYAVGCTEKFYSCSNGISTGHECPKDLVFNVDSGFCDYPKNVLACGGHRLTLNDDEINVEEGGIASNLVSGCSILEDGIYGLSPCGSGYYHCLHGATSFAKCAFDLVFNPLLNRCDFRENVPACTQYNGTSNKIKAPIHGLTIKSAADDASKCENLSDGFYVEGCSRVYYGCANGEKFYMNCPWNLAFDYRSGTCDEPKNVEACRSEEAPSSLLDSTASPMPSCTTLSNGAYQFAPCLADYILCRDGITNLASCPDPLVFNPDNSRCVLQSEVEACKKVNQSTKDKPDILCAARPNGIFSHNCSKNFYICAKGRAYLFTCPDGMIYDSKFRRCGNSAEVQACVQAESSIVQLLPKPSLTSPRIIVKSDDKFCDGRPDSNYAAGVCSPIFFSCVHMKNVLMSCPETLVFDSSTNRCEDPENVAECRNNSSFSGQNVAEQLITFTVTPLCVGRKDNIYALDSCLRSYLQCDNEKGIVKYCPDDMVFDGNVSACIPKAVCNREMPIAPGGAGNGDVEKEEASKYSLPRCHELADGDYSAGCVSDFTTCVRGSGIRKKCSNSTVFSNVLRRCVSYDQCAFLMYRVLASFYPSDRLESQKEWMIEGSTVITPSASDPILPPPETSSSSEDTNPCEHTRKQCANEASVSEGVDQTPTEEPETIEPNQKEENGVKFCVPEVFGSPIDSIRCDNMEDGLYSLDCSNKVAICSGGWKKIYGCPKGQFFIPALAKCDESWKCIETDPCGSGFVGVVYLGKAESIVPSVPTVSTGRFSCANREDGNYGRQCSPMYIKCVQQTPILMRCQAGRLFDQRSSRCVPSDRCPTLSTTLDVRCVENERFGISECNDYYYTCSNGKFLLYKCPPGRVFDNVHGVCGSKCELCGCEADDLTSMSPCSPGEVVPLGPCENTYLECSAHRTFELRQCVNDKYFDPVRFICRFQYEIAGCSGDSILVPALYRVHDSFKHPLQFNLHLTRKRHNSNRYSLRPYVQPVRITSPRNPDIFSGTFLAPSRKIFIPLINQVPRVPENSVAQSRDVKDIFRVVPSLRERISNMRTVGIIDHFHLPSNHPTYFGVSRPSVSHDSTVTLSPDPDGTISRNGAVDSLEGSGEGDNASAVTGSGRVKRQISFDTEPSEMKLEAELEKWETDLDVELEDNYASNGLNRCPEIHASNITLGICHPSFIFCTGKKNHAYLVDCRSGQLFDNELKECVSATDCILRAYRQGNGKTPCALLSDGTYALLGCSKYFLSCVSNKALLRSCESGLYYDGSKQQCDYKERIASCDPESTTYEQPSLSAKGQSDVENVREEAKIEAVNADHEVSLTLPNFTCSINSTISFGCSPSFVICAGNTAYVFNCDGDLVFDQVVSSCNRIEDTPECDEQDGKQRMLSVTSDFSSSSSLTGLDDLPHTLVNLTRVSYDASSFDCVNAPDGLYASKCSPLFFVCSAGHITGFVCQDELYFNVETGFCDQKEYVTSCEGADLVNSSITSSSITEKVSLEPSLTTAQQSYRSTSAGQWECEDEFSGIMSRDCSRKFLLCIHGEGHLFFCQQGLVYNINKNRCDHMRNVAACGNKAGISFRRRAYRTSHFKNDSTSSFRVVDLRAVGSSKRRIQARCNASRDQVAAYGRCRGEYISCSPSGDLRKSYCTNGYLFDEYVGRCVPAEVCGIIDDAVVKSVSSGKEICDGVEDGTSKRIGPCLSEYYVCKKGTAIHRRCFKYLETFSATAGACVPRSSNPECLQRVTVLTDGIKRLNNTEDFCIHRSDGLYRHPTDCARIVQCFDEETFEQLPCNDGLVFNEISGGCDYKSNVQECAATSEKSEKGDDPPSVNGSNCSGNSHGDHLADKKDCSVFYRCVWGKLEKLFCPEHTVFNPALSVCDFPSAVPYCNVTM